MAKDYIALIRKESASDFGVSFPDLPGCVTAGRTLDEALAAAHEALALHLEGLAEDGTLETAMAKRANRDAVAALVPAPVIKARAVRVNVTLPEDLLNAIDSTAGPGGRSGFLAAAARDKLGASGVKSPAK